MYIYKILIKISQACYIKTATYTVMQNRITTKLIWKRGSQDTSYTPQNLFAGKALSVTDNIPTMCINNDIQAVHFSVIGKNSCKVK
jgi:hypothetical protein